MQVSPNCNITVYFIKSNFIARDFCFLLYDTRGHIVVDLKPFKEESPQQSTSKFPKVQALQKASVIFNYDYS